MDKQTISLESLNRAKQGDSLVNYPAIIKGFIEKGVNPLDIKPRENIFTYNAWQALKRQVRKGETGVKCVTWIDTETKDTGKPSKLVRPVSVFHISQTDPIH
jgi:hypothetical protein